MTDWPYGQVIFACYVKDGTFNGVPWGVTPVKHVLFGVNDLN